jgi:hypothetical protein
VLGRAAGPGEYPNWPLSQPGRQHRQHQHAVQAVDPSGPVSTSFQLQNAARFPEGDYSVDIFINGQPVGTRNFRVLE